MVPRGGVWPAGGTTQAHVQGSRHSERMDHPAPHRHGRVSRLIRLGAVTAARCPGSGTSGRTRRLLRAATTSPQAAFLFLRWTMVICARLVRAHKETPP